MNRTTASSLLLVILLLSAPPDVSFSQTYTYKDANGTIAYVDDLGKVPKKYRSKARSMDDTPTFSVVESASPVGPGRRTGSKQAVRTEAKPKKFSGTIEIYWASYCPVCKDAERYLKQMNYPYVKYDVEKDSGARERAEKYPGRGVPLIIVGKKTMRGFSPEALEQYMEE